jgi:hypothetical protein
LVVVLVVVVVSGGKSDGFSCGFDGGVIFLFW